MVTYKDWVSKCQFRPKTNYYQYYVVSHINCLLFDCKSVHMAFVLQFKSVGLV